ncbi:MAG TPA: alpha/beta fold hydrolase [Usitatibacter sp.]|nr:alpha/beta fold hydrolase [Usitatibacter sp.]
MELLPHLELATGAQPQGSVIWLHGLGADGWDFVPLVRELTAPQNLELRFIFPHAPERAVTINNGYVMRAWYDITKSDIARLPDERGIRESQAAVEKLVEREGARGVDSTRIVLAGFSQGGAIALHTGLRYPKPLAGIVALSAYLPLPEALAREASEANRGTPIFMGHGSEDPIVPLALAEASQAALRARGYRVEWHTWPMPHAVCAEEIETLREFLRGIYTPGAGHAAPARSSILLP